MLYPIELRAHFDTIIPVSTQTNLHNRETEIKLRVTDAESARRLIEQNGFSESSPRILERNRLFDTADGSLRRQGMLIRIREQGGRAILTYKGKAATGVHKSREEIEVEVEVSEAPALKAIFGRLGYIPGFRYEKYRETWAWERVHVLEIEGDPEWIDGTAARLGFGPPAYITASYHKLYLEYCERHSIKPGNLEF